MGSTGAFDADAFKGAWDEIYLAEMALTPAQRAARTRREKRDRELVTIERGELERLRLRERVLSVYREPPMFNVHGQCINDPDVTRRLCNVVSGPCNCKGKGKR